jgi:uncharacterized membrane protein YoaK (UPF0700 family)
LLTMLSIEVLLLLLGGILAIRFGPFGKDDQFALTVTGMALVAAMAIQNAASRVHLGSAPPTTLMTGTTTQMMIDLADLIRGVPDELGLAAKARLAKMGDNVLGFALGCAAGAALFSIGGGWCFALPPLIGLIPVLMPASKID